MRRIVCALTLLAGVLLAPAAQAGDLPSSATSCSGQTLERPFLPWLDVFEYTLAPNGTLESTAGWNLAGGARLANGNESFFVHGATEMHSLALPAGSSATTRPMCVGLAHPTLRFFARNTGSVLSLLRVEVIYKGLAGSVRSLPIGLLAGGRDWRPTLPLPLIENIKGSLLSGNGTTAIAMRFTPLGRGGAWQIDDVYVDPFRGR
jgi:hypothetical protein